MALLSDIEHYEKVRDGWLLDTNIISATIGDRPVPDGIRDLFERVADERFWLSVVTIGEINKGINLIRPPRHVTDMYEILERPETKKRHLLNAKLEILESTWADRIIPIDVRVAKMWGELQAHYQAQGNPVPAVDALIAATAYVHNLVVVSNDQIFARMRDRISSYDPMSVRAN